MQLQTSLIIAAIYVSCALGAVIVPGATWTDTSGNVIQAHGGGFLKVRIIHWQFLSVALKQSGWVLVLLVR